MLYLYGNCHFRFSSLEKWQVRAEVCSTLTFPRPEKIFYLCLIIVHYLFYLRRTILTVTYKHAMVAWCVSICFKIELNLLKSYIHFSNLFFPVDPITDSWWLEERVMWQLLSAFLMSLLLDQAKNKCVMWEAVMGTTSCMSWIRANNSVIFWFYSVVTLLLSCDV